MNVIIVRMVTTVVSNVQIARSLKAIHILLDLCCAAYVCRGGRGVHVSTYAQYIGDGIM